MDPKKMINAPRGERARNIIDQRKEKTMNEQEIKGIMFANVDMITEELTNLNWPC